MQRAAATVRHLLVRRDFRRLLATRLCAQFGDGVLQAALAGTVLFNPQRAADPVDVAAGFAVLLLPYSLVGPFAGVWLDRWSRRQVLLHANVVRAGLVAVLAALTAAGVDGGPFYLTGLAVFSVNRFILSALSAALPHTTDAPSLVSANALSTTAGSVATVVGAAATVALLPLAGTGDTAYAVVTLAAALPYLAAAGVVTGLGRPELGPDHTARSALLSAREVLAGMVAGARHLRAHRPAVAALGVITVHRLCFGLLTLMTLLLFRNTFDAWGPVPGGLAGLGVVVAAGAVGTLLAALVTPRMVRRLGAPRWIVLQLAGGGVLLVALGLPFRPPTAVLTGLVLAFVGQAVKICVDTTLQAVDDDFRGRVFAVYDMLVNVSYVLALVAGAFLLPESGISSPVLLAVGALYLLAALGYGVDSYGSRGRIHSAQATMRPISEPQAGPSSRNRRTG
ncbi:MFS transporter [Geodermatophilus ruber]|uniref:Major Facilitator Superfamily protein n=1 Tax=Geodermatophilus ruber TaxID=504800 RepID=A0A1I4J6R6_9ACTN|nr:MFS transporter [Geodermatophilus ruber]SFL61776.1 Major Facilitator Superfamily protein [Geodermatophilus ruber]